MRCNTARVALTRRYTDITRKKFQYTLLKQQLLISIASCARFRLAYCLGVCEYTSILCLFKYSNPPQKKSLPRAQRSRETLHFTYFSFYLSFSKAARKKPLVSSSLPGSKRCTSLHSSSDSPQPGLPSPPTLRERERVERGRSRATDRESGTQLDACKQCAMRKAQGAMLAHLSVR